MFTDQGSNKPLLDKTPFHNRQNPLSTPAPQTFKIAKLAYNDNNPAQLDGPLPGSALLRPSSMRKSLRGRTSSDEKGLKPLAFKTPVSQGRHWDVSDVSIEVPNEAELDVSIAEDDFDEIEYMPPKQPGMTPRLSVTLQALTYYSEQPYHPPFDFAIPDYKELGLNLRSLAQSYNFDDSAELMHTTELDFSLQGISEMPKMHLSPLGLRKLHLPRPQTLIRFFIDNEDDPFFVNRAPPKPKATLAPRAVPSQSKSTPTIPTRKATVRSTASVLTRPNVTAPRSGARPIQSITRPVSTIPRQQPRSTSLAIRPASTIPRSTSTLSSIRSAAASRRAAVKVASKSTLDNRGSAVASSSTPSKNDLNLMFDVGGDIDDFRFDV